MNCWKNSWWHIFKEMNKINLQLQNLSHFQKSIVLICSNWQHTYKYLKWWEEYFSSTRTILFSLSLFWWKMHWELFLSSFVLSNLKLIHYIIAIFTSIPKDIQLNIIIATSNFFISILSKLFQQALYPDNFFS